MRELVRLLRNKRFRITFFMFIGFFVQFWWLGKRKKFLSKERKEAKYKKVYTRQAKRFAATAVELGGLIIKLGQFVSSRVDILPKEYTDILSELQDSVAPVETKIVVKRIEQELSASVDVLFKNFDYTPVAAASLGQVHKAFLKNGEMLAIKVMRPGIEDIVALDLSTLKMLIRFAQRFTKVEKFVDLDDVYQEFDEVINEELDYKKEVKNLETFRDQFADFPGVSVPTVYKEFSTSKVLVMEFVEGVKINEIDRLEGKVNQKKLAKILYLSYLKQLMEDGFFHADPHPGNLLVKNDGTLVYIDFGMVGMVSDQMKENIVKLSLSIYLKDPGGIVAALDDLGFLRKQTDKAALTKNVKVILSSFSDGGFNIKKIQNEDFLDELREFLYQQPFQIPSQTTFLGKAIMMVFSICNGLDPDFDLVALTKPYVEEMMGSAEASPTKEKVFDQVKSTFLNVIPTFRKAVNLIDQFESGEIRMAPPKSFEKNLADMQIYQTRRIVFAVFGTGLLIAGSQIMNQHNGVGISFMIVGGLITLFQAVRTGSGRRRGPRRHPFVHKNR
jgi:predicted unusual protein kinase regulating ubiquinone biosynthesis (AarF/ABC1/UbiB family)